MDIDSIALEAARNVMNELLANSYPKGGNIQLQAIIQCKISDVLRQQLAEQTSETLPVPYWAVVYALTAMTKQYLQRDDGTIFHQFMSAGEAATEVLERLGILTDEFGTITDEAWEESWVENHIATYSKPITAEDK
jgi:hypothetical protein